ncbi:MAG: IPTL-CTERM sorting domain-containing protein, partial [Candidatus Rokuibacteriota bacterium]
GGSGNTTFTTSTVTCTGAFDQTTTTTTVALGPGHICVGPNKSVGFFVCPGTQNINTNVAVPTLSVWGFGVLVVTLGAFALRRLRVTPSRSSTGICSFTSPTRVRCWRAAR